MSRGPGLACVVVATILSACGGKTPANVEAPGEQDVAASHTVSEGPTATVASEGDGTSRLFMGVVAVLPVKDHAAASAWYRKWIGRDADVTPMEGVAEWNLAGGGWIQVALDPEQAGRATVVVTVPDAEGMHRICTDAGLNPGPVQDHGVVKMLEIADPDGNKVFFVQEVAQP